MRIRKLLVVVGLVAVLAVGLLAGRELEKMGNPDSTGDPASTSSYTLEDIYNRLVSGTEGTQNTFKEPTVAAGTGTMYTIDVIMGKAPVRKDGAGATTADVVANKQFWGLNVNAGQWGLRTGTMPVGSNVSGPNGSETFSIPNGYYSGKTATANDTALVDSNIKAGVDIFSVTGTYTGPARFTVNGDTVTDNQTNLMWTKKGNDGWMTWLVAVAYCSGLNTGGHNDWRLPEILELFSLVDKRQANPALPDGHPFTDAQTSGRSTSVTPWGDSTTIVRAVHMEDGTLGIASKDALYYVWPVRGP